MSANEEKARLSKLLQNLEVAEDRLPERCQPLLKELQEKFGEELTENEVESENQEYVNPYIPDRGLLEENDRKLRELLGEEKRTPKVQNEDLLNTEQDPKRSWRTNSNKEKLLRVDSDLKRLKTSNSLISVEKADPLEGDVSKMNSLQGELNKSAPTAVQ